ncbi:hypothetical protein OG874_02040 [Nocardia sp. NBC_00565]|uniref:hypothetical protein n=1 Tax=Nocardia sp. NBC_00565 TaxID=2975993 RepID=UPI002E7FFC28|nr:hypothetical protein [Nocardia sp. NBC_00565]WUC04018.1 hypothetical protein OG874_02040 [Nocardia sp. NBC_00565]
MGLDSSAAARYGGIVPPGFTELRPGVSEFLVVAVDFDLTTRGEAGFRDLAALLPDSVTVWLTAQPPASVADTASGEAYTAWWWDRLAAAGAEIDAVLGYCAGGVFASALADEVARQEGRRPATVLFNPGRPTKDSVFRDIRTTLTALSSLSGAERDDLIGEASALLGEWPRDVPGILDRLLALYRDAAHAAFERVGIAPDVGAELIDVFASYTAYLRAASTMAARPQWSSATALISVEDDGEPDFTVHRVPTTIGRRDLLRTPEVARLVMNAMQPERRS